MRINLDYLDYDFGPNQEKRDALKEAISTGDLVLVKKLLATERDVNFVVTRGSGCWSLLHEAAQAGQTEIARFLLKRGANIGAPDFEYVTPLHQAAIEGHVQVVALLLSKWADANARDSYDSTPLHYAAASGQLEVVAFLSNHGGDFHARDLDGRTPLHDAAVNGFTKTVKLLLDAGADIDAKTVDPPEEYNDPAAELDAGDLEGEGLTPLHLAAAAGHADVVRVLLARGANTSIIAKGKGTPLELAQQFEQLRIVQILAKAGVTH